MGEEKEEKNIGILFFVLLFILNFFMLIISIFLFYLIIKSKAFNNYQCYNAIIFSLVILLDCIVRMISFSGSLWEYLQAFLLTFFDKVILATITTHIILFYLGVIHTKKFYDNDKIAFYISFVINFVVCLVLTILYIKLEGIYQPNGNGYFYCRSTKFKEILDPIFNSVYLIPNLYCSFILITFLLGKIKEVKSGITEDYDYNRNFKRTLIMTLLNIICFLESYLIIFDVLGGPKTDIIYLSTLLLICLCNCLNKTVIKETMKIFCKNKYKQKYGNEEKGNQIDEEEDENDEKLIQTNTYKE